MIERTNIFCKMYDILGFSNFLYFPQITQYAFFIYLVVENILVLFYHSFHNQEKINLYTLNKLLRFNMKSINPINVSAHYCIICLHSNICYIFISNEFPNFFWEMFNSKTIKISYIIIINIQSNSMSSSWFILIKIYYLCPILYFR